MVKVFDKPEEFDFPAQDPDTRERLTCEKAVDVTDACPGLLEGQRCLLFYAQTKKDRGLLCRYSLRDVGGELRVGTCFCMGEHGFQQDVGFVESIAEDLGLYSSEFLDLMRTHAPKV